MADASSYDNLLKVLLIGDAGVGKSSMLLRFTEDTFDENLGSTIGVDFKVKMVEAKSGVFDARRAARLISGGGGPRASVAPTGRRQEDKAHALGHGGQERFRTLTSSYYRGAQGIMLTYSVDDRQSFDNIERWIADVCVAALPPCLTVVATLTA